MKRHGTGQRQKRYKKGRESEGERQREQAEGERDREGNKGGETEGDIRVRDIGINKKKQTEKIGNANKFILASTLQYEQKLIQSSAADGILLSV
jgi:hypothetical protein